MTAPVGDLPVGALLATAHRRHPERVAVVSLRRTITYASLRRQVRRFAAGLARQGVVPGDRVSILLPPCPQHLVATLAVMRLGGVAVLHSHLVPVPALARQVRAAGSVGVVTIDHAYPVVDAVRAAGLRFVVVTALSDYLPPTGKAGRLIGRPPAPADAEWLRARAAPDPRSLGFMDVVRTPRGRVRQAPVTPATTPALACFAAGLSGVHDARGVPLPVPTVLTHGQLTAAAALLATQVLDPAGGTQVLLPVAPAFTPTAVMWWLAGIATGATTVLLPRFDTEGAWSAVADHGVRTVLGVPGALAALAERAEVAGLAPPVGRAGLRHVVTGGTPISAAGRATLVRALGAPVTGTWGPADCAGLVTVLGRGDSAEPTDPDAADTADTGEWFVVGRALPGCVVRPADGGLAAVGPQVPGLVRQVADRGVLRHDGLAEVLLPARARDAVTSGGIEYAPAEVAAVLRSHPEVADAAVVGVPHSVRGQATRAFVVPEAGGAVDPAGLFRFVRGQLEPHKVPRELVAVDGLPQPGSPDRTLGPWPE